MSRKSAKTKPYKRQAVRGNSASAAPIPGWVWLVTGMVMGIGLMLFVMIAGWAPKYGGSDTPEEPRPQSANAADSDESNSGPDRKPQYDFYTVLPEMEVVVPESQIAEPGPTRADQPAERYLIQVGSFRESADAERTKAQLALLGVEASIVAVTINDATWHRVRIGPFDDLRQLDQVRQQLRQNDFDALVLSESS